MSDSRPTRRCPLCKYRAGLKEMQSKRGYDVCDSCIKLIGWPAAIKELKRIDTEWAARQKEIARLERELSDLRDWRDRPSPLVRRSSKS
jgi:hypothetical protein